MRPNFVTKKLEKLVPIINGTLLVEPTYQYCGCIIFENGQKTFYKESSFDVNSHGAVKIAIDKGYSNYFLSQFGFNVPKYDTFVSPALSQYLNVPKGVEEGIGFAKSIGFPVVIKPNEGTKGTHVYKVTNEIEFRECAKMLFEDSKVMLVQKFVTGNDYRIVVFDKKVYCAYQRIPLQVEGDGVHSLFYLLNKKQVQMESNDGSNRFNLLDVRIQENIRKKGLSLDTVLTKGEVVRLLDLANLSLGGKAIDLTDSISPEFKELAIDITHKMGLNLCGIDIIANNIEEGTSDYWVIEINSSPGHSNYALIGERQSKVIDQLYLDMLMQIRDRVGGVYSPTSQDL